VLPTTPEPADALPAGHVRIVATSRAIVLDEPHLLDGTPRRLRGHMLAYLCP
jgi:hypothetical protein